MYAIIQDGGNQYKVAEGMTVRLEKKNLTAGQEIQFPDVLLYSNQAPIQSGPDDIRLGNPFVNGVKVIGQVVDQIKGEKITIVKFKRRKNYRRKTGHRQNYTTVKIIKIAVP